MVTTGKRPKSSEMLKSFGAVAPFLLGSVHGIRLRAMATFVTFPKPNIRHPPILLPQWSNTTHITPIGVAARRRANSTMSLPAVLRLIRQPPLLRQPEDSLSWIIYHQQQQQQQHGVSRGLFLCDSSSAAVDSRRIAKSPPLLFDQKRTYSYLLGAVDFILFCV